MTWKTAGHNDWFRVTTDPSFGMEIVKPAQQLYENFVDAGNYTINLIAQDWGHKPLYLTLSGGLDSEFVADRLIENKIKFTPIIVKIDLTNELETWYAEYWCYKHNIKPIILYYNMGQLADSMKQYYRQLKELTNFSLTPQMIVYDYVNQQNGHLIYCAGDMQIDAKTKDQFYLHTFDVISDVTSVGTHPTSFYLYTPEILLSYMSQYNIELSENYNKINAYKVWPRPKVAYQSYLDNNSLYLEQKNKLIFLAKIDVSKNQLNRPCYFGTREQIIQKLTT